MINSIIMWTLCCQIGMFWHTHHGNESFFGVWSFCVTLWKIKIQSPCHSAVLSRWRAGRHCQLPLLVPGMTHSSCDHGTFTAAQVVCFSVCLPFPPCALFLCVFFSPKSRFVHAESLFCSVRNFFKSCLSQTRPWKALCKHISRISFNTNQIGYTQKYDNKWKRNYRCKSPWNRRQNVIFFSIFAS